VHICIRYYISIDSISSGAIVGIAVGAVVAIVIIIIILILIFVTVVKRKRRNHVPVMYKDPVENSSTDQGPRLLKY